MNEYNKKKGKVIKKGTIGLCFFFRNFFTIYEILMIKENKLFLGKDLISRTE
jgi:hypothetical protein